VPFKSKQILRKKLIKSPVVQRLSDYFLIIYEAFPHILYSIEGLGGRSLLSPFDKARKSNDGLVGRTRPQSHILLSVFNTTYIHTHQEVFSIFVKYYLT
jgi:hypothetical protein